MAKTTENFVLPIKFDTFIQGFREQQLQPSANPLTYFADIVPQLNKFALGTYCWFISDMTQPKIIAGGGMTKQVTGFDLEQFLEDLTFMQYVTHPEDVEKCTAFAMQSLYLKKHMQPTKRKHLNVNFYCRGNLAVNACKWLMFQAVEEVFDEEDNLLFCLTTLTDISHLRKKGEPMMTIFNTFDEENQVFYCLNVGDSLVLSEPVKTRLTVKEKEILKYLAMGKASKQIAAELKVSVKTVDNHRQKMLRKTGTASSPALVMHAVENGWL
ncbi:MAG: response regulator transcription factor [Verrucomicrobia bacterium]|nr:response regulator transcription factor [Cytophagales bacterium]